MSELPNPNFPSPDIVPPTSGEWKEVPIEWLYVPGGAQPDGETASAPIGRPDDDSTAGGMTSTGQASEDANPGQDVNHDAAPQPPPEDAGEPVTGSHLGPMTGSGNSCDPAAEPVTPGAGPAPATLAPGEKAGSVVPLGDSFDGEATGEVSPVQQTKSVAETRTVVSTTHRGVYSAFYADCQPAKADGYLCKAQVPPLRRVPANVNEIICRLAEGFAREAVVAAGLATNGRGDGPLSPTLSEGTLMAGLHLDAAGAPGELMVAAGALGLPGRTWKVLREDPRLAQERLWLTGDLADAAVLLACGRAAMPVSAVGPIDAGFMDLVKNIWPAGVVVVTSSLTDPEKKEHPAVVAFIRKVRDTLSHPDRENKALVLIRPCDSQMEELRHALQDEAGLREYLDVYGKSISLGAPLGRILSTGCRELTPCVCLTVNLLDQVRVGTLRLVSVEPMRTLPVAIAAEWKRARKAIPFNGLIRNAQLATTGTPRALHDWEIVRLYDCEPKDVVGAAISMVAGVKWPPPEPAAVPDLNVLPWCWPAHVGRFCRAQVEVFDLTRWMFCPETEVAYLCETPTTKPGAVVRAAVNQIVLPSGQSALFAQDIFVVGAGWDGGGDHSVAGVIRLFVVSPTPEALAARWRELGDWLAGLVGLGGPQAGQMASVTVLTHLSPIELVQPNGRRLANAALQVSVTGESGGLKTTVLGGLSELIGLARTASSDTITRTGLLYRYEKGKLQPGLLPLCHGKMLALDEFHKVKPEEIRAATYARGQGVLQVDGMASATWPMRTRLLCAGNLRQAGARGFNGSKSLSLADLEAGILGIGFLEIEDIRRFDLVFVAARQGCVPAPVVVPPPLFLEQVVSLVELAWQLGDAGKDEIVWHDGAWEAVQARAEALRREFEYDAIPLLSSDTVDKLCRVTASAARLMVSDPDGRIHITVGHVNWAADLVAENYRSPVNGLGDLVAMTRDQTGQDEQDLFNALPQLQDEIRPLEAIVNVFAQGGKVTRLRLAAATKYSVSQVDKWLKILKKVGLVTTHGCAGIHPTSLMRRLATAIRAQKEAGGQPQRYCSPRP